MSIDVRSIFLVGFKLSELDFNWDEDQDGNLERTNGLNLDWNFGNPTGYDETDLFGFYLQTGFNHDVKEYDLDIFLHDLTIVQDRLKVIGKPKILITGFMW